MRTLLLPLSPPPGWSTGYSPVQSICIGGESPEEISSSSHPPLGEYWLRPCVARRGVPLLPLHTAPSVRGLGAAAREEDALVVSQTQVRADRYTLRPTIVTSGSDKQRSTPL